MRWCIALALAATAAAHDLQVAFDRAGAAIIAHAAYGGTAPCAYASVLVYAPGELKTEYQNGRTDAKGIFAFVPDRPGTWRFVIDDELGHRRELTVEAAAGNLNTAASSEVLPWRNVATGLSLILGLTGFVYAWKARRPH